MNQVVGQFVDSHPLGKHNKRPKYSPRNGDWVVAIPGAIDTLRLFCRAQVTSQAGSGDRAVEDVR
jgi:hypothetical protein